MSAEHLFSVRSPVLELLAAVDVLRCLSCGAQLGPLGALLLVLVLLVGAWLLSLGTHSPPAGLPPDPVAVPVAQEARLDPEDLPLLEDADLELPTPAEVGDTWPPTEPPRPRPMRLPVPPSTPAEDDTAPQRQARVWTFRRRKEGQERPERRKAPHRPVHREEPPVRERPPLRVINGGRGPGRNG